MIFLKKILLALKDHTTGSFRSILPLDSLEANIFPLTADQLNTFVYEVKMGLLILNN